ncbi:MAG: TCR/Tet family MFS transporter [Candidatus Sumerlaeia bacterium]
MRKRTLTTIFLIVFVDMLGIGLMIPVLPDYLKHFGGGDVAYGWFIGLHPLMQLVSTPVLGRLSDVYGRRLLLLVSLAGTIVAWLTLGFAQALWVLFAARILDGVTGGNIAVAQAVVTDVTEDKDRARGLGLIGAAIGLGFVCGPAIGGLLGAWHMRAPAFAAAVLSLANWIGLFLYLPETRDPAVVAARPVGPRGVLMLGALGRMLRRPMIGPLLVTRLVYFFPFAVFEGIFMLDLVNRFGLGPRGGGLVMTYVGVLIAAVQGGLIGRLANRFGEPALIKASFGVMALGFLGWGLAPDLWLLCVILAPLSLALGIQNTATRSLLSKVAAREDQGGTLGLAAALDGLNRAAGPVAGGYLVRHLGYWSPGVAGAVICALVLPYVLLKISDPR